MGNNLLQNLTQSGALNVYNPMESYGKALAAKTMKSNLLSGEMNREAKALTLFRSYVGQAENLEDYNQVRQYATDNLGMNTDLMPEFETNEEFVAARPRMATGLEEAIKAKEGKQFTIHKKGTTSELKVTTEKYNELVENKWIVADEWGMGTADKTEKPDKKAYQRKTREEEIRGFMVKTDYDFDPSTGKEKLKKVYFSGGEPSQTQVEKFNAMLDESSQETQDKYRGNMALWLHDNKKAGAPSMTQIIAGEKFDIQKDQTAGELRGILTTAKEDKDSFEANAFQYNKINTKNEVAYWDSKEEWYGDEKTKIIKLSPEAVELGWTPEKIQEAATKKAITVKKVLIELGVIKE